MEHSSLTTPDHSPRGSIPSHLSEKIFREYEPFIMRAVNAFPTETSFTVPSDRSPATFLARFRDAILSVKNFKWQTTIDMDKLWRLSAERKFALRHGVINGSPVVWFGNRIRQGVPNGLLSEAREYTASNPARIGAVPLRDITEEELRALVVLLNGRHLAGSWSTPTAFPFELISQLTLSYDVAISRDEITGLTVIT